MREEQWMVEFSANRVWRNAGPYALRGECFPTREEAEACLRQYKEVAVDSAIRELTRAQAKLDQAIAVLGTPPTVKS